MNQDAGIRSLAVSFPDHLRTNDYWLERYPDAVASAKERALARLFSRTSQHASDNPFDIEMTPYLDDPFRGTVERRVLGPGEGSILIEERAAASALAAASLGLRDVDAVMVSSIMPDTFGVGNAAHLTRRMGITAPAWNFESGCASTTVGVQTAAALVRAGEYRNVLVVVSNSNSRILEPTDSLSWFIADGAGAMVIGEVPSGEGVLGSKIIGTQETCGAFVFELDTDAKGAPCIRMRTGEESAGRLMRERSADQLRACVDGALQRAAVKLDEIDFFVFNTPVAWFAPFCARVLGVDAARTISVYPSYGNVAAALTTANLFHAAEAGKIKRGDLVLVYAVGSISTAGAVVMRWGDVALGPPPPPSKSLTRSVS